MSERKTDHEIITEKFPFEVLPLSRVNQVVTRQC